MKSSYFLLRKGVYPYEYMDNWNKFDETSLPSKEEFFSNLNISNISDKGYEYANKVWNTFNIKNLSEYHNLYVQSDTALLSDVFESFRNTCLKEYELEPCYFVSAPGLAWDSMLKITNVKLELLIDIDMLLLIEEGTTGGISRAIHKYATANNKYMKSFNNKLISIFLQYLDKYNLYRWAMCKKLPIGGFKWINPNQYSEEKIKNYDEDGSTGAILKVDIEYPKELHHLHKDLPFLCEKRKLDKTSKLVTTLGDKIEYVVHICALKQALNHGLVLTKIHNVLEFKQAAWMKKYIDKNTKLGNESKNEFEKSFFKLMNNSVCGKTMENVRKHRDIKLVTTDSERKKLVSEPNYHTCKQFSEDLMAIEMKKTKIHMNKSLYVGQAVLDISKTLMYEFWYDYIIPKYSDNAKLCYMNTDSFIFTIKTNDFYEDIMSDLEKWYDTSKIDQKLNRCIPIGINEGVIGMFKDELNGNVMTDFVSLASKLYAFIDDKDKCEKKAKGVKKCVIKKSTET